MKAKSIKGRSVEEIKRALEQATGDGFQPTIAFVFISVGQNRDGLCTMLDEAGITIYGATTNGEFIDENYEQGTISILLLDVSKRYFFVQFAELNGKNDRHITAGLGKMALKRFRHPAFLITGSSLQTDIEEMIGGLIDSVGNAATIAGAMAGDDLKMTGQFVFTNNKCGDRAVVILVLDEDAIIMRARASHGWRAVGTEKTVTKSDRNRVFTIDNVAALDLCLKYSGLPIDHPNLVFELAANFPIQLQRENGDPLMRPSYMINWEDHSLMTSGKLPQNSRIRFSLPPDFDVIEKVIEENRKFKETEMPEADALILYNCGGRLMSFGPLISEEIKGIKEVWNVPLAGMFSNAEIGPTRNGNVEMHNLTTCWVALKEK
jgi:hypothetical protein